MAQLTLNPTGAEVRHLLEATYEHADAKKALAGLPLEDAFTPVGAYPHTIAALVAHMHFWQQRRLSFARGEDPGWDEQFKLGVTDFPEVTREEWPRLCEEFLASYEDMIAAAEDQAGMARVVYEELTAGFMLASHACHNSYHLGQIVMLRIMQGNWQREH